MVLEGITERLTPVYTNYNFRRILGRLNLVWSAVYCLASSHRSEFQPFYQTPGPRDEYSESE